MADPIKVIEQVAEETAVKKILEFLIAQLISVLPSWLSWAGGPISWVVMYFAKKLGHAAIIEIGNKFIGLRKAGQAAAATDKGKKLQEVLNKPDSTQEEIDNANKEFDDIYSELIHINH
jgi:hypothetical protein